MRLKTFFACAMSMALLGTPAWAVDNKMYAAGAAKTEVIQQPMPGRPAEADLGRSMVSFHRQTAIPAIRISTPVTSKEVGIQLNIPAGLLYLKGVNPEGKFYQSDSFVEVVSLGVSLPHEFGGLFVPNDTSKPMYTYRYMAFGPKLRPVGQIPYEPATYVENGKVSFRVEFIYTGVANNILSATYREFRDDMARPAFSQDLKYDISQDKVIGFKGARIEVLSAGNVGIKYVVQKGFDDVF
ncbi:hypothetical protein LJR164_001181 [Phenylobacterium sp. LjRoot164]|uniref:hypothetical protein n=1 Tax=unclassified Phenylobacterium TaxID=2640670 RepID=UPI003ECD4329